MKAKTSSNRVRGFTLVEILIAVGVIAVLLAILVPVVNSARKSARSTVCQANLRMLGQCIAMYYADNQRAMPFPSTTFGESGLWFNAVDKYLNLQQGRAGATGAARERAYRHYKQCAFWSDYGDKKNEGAQDPIVEAAKFFKMNSNLRRTGLPQRFNPFTGSQTKVDFARISIIKQPAKHVLIGDGVSLDMVPNVNNQNESSSFVMDINETSEANPGLRHFGGANILFIDMHVELVNNLPTIRKNLNNPHAAISVDSWEGEYRIGSPTGAIIDPPTNVGGVRTMEQLGYVRNPNMPLIWSELGRLYRNDTSP
jgi:prepilin-type N-terminal cleavage/methylation domain-containing protein